MATFRSRASSSSGGNLNDLATLEALVKDLPQAPKPNRALSALKAVGGVLGATNSLVAGATRAFVKGENPITASSKAFWESLANGNQTSFSDVIKDNYTPQGLGEKVAVEALGFTADIIFDPLTYLTFGLGKGVQLTTKAGNKLMTKTAQKTFQNASRELAELGIKESDELIKKVMAKAVDDGIDNAARASFKKFGVTDKVIDDIISIAPKIIDEGGIKFAGQSIVKGSTIAESKIGQAAKALGQTKFVQEKADALKTLFSFGGKIDPRISKALEEAAAKTSKATDDIIYQMQKLFGGTTQSQRDEFFKVVNEAKRSLISRTDAKVALEASKSDEALKAITGLRSVKKNGELTKAAKDILESKARKEVKAEMEKETLTFTDPRLQKLSNELFEGKNAIVKKMADLAGIPKDQQIKFYVPTKYEEFEKIAKGTKSLSGLSSVKKGFQKKFTGVEREDQIMDAFKLYTERQIEVTAARIKTETIQKVAKEVGTSAEDIAKMAEEILGTTGKKLSKEAIEKAADKMGYAKITRETLDGKAEFFVPKEAKEAIDDLFNPKNTAIDTLGKLTGFDFMTRLFKGYVTAPFPGFHIRNMTSNQFQNAIALGVNTLNPVLQKQGLELSLLAALKRSDSQLAKGLAEKTFTTKTGKTIKYADLLEQIQNKTTFLDAGAFGNFEQLIKEASKQLTGKKFDLNLLNPFSSKFAPVSGGRAVGNVIENQSKLMHIVAQLRDGKTLDEAIKSAEEVLFNYSKLTPFEKNVMRRVIPFYTFMSRNAALQAKTLARQPGFVANQLKAFRSAGNVGGELTEEEEQGIPDYLLSSLGINLGKNELGQPRILSGFGLPIEEFLSRFSGEKGFMWNAISNTIAQSNPLIRFPIERTADVDLFYGQPIGEIRNAKALKSLFDVMPDAAADQLKSLVGYYEKEVNVYRNGKKVGTEIKGYADPYALHLMRNLPTARLQSTQEFLSSSDQALTDKALRFFTGAKAYSIDTERGKFFKELERKKDLQKFLVDVLGYKTFETIYKPK